MTVVINGTTGVDTIQDAKVSPAKLTVNGSGGFTLPTSAGNAVVADSSGRVTKPYQPAFRATGDNNSQSLTSSTATVVIFDATETNIGNNYNTSNGRFTAPIAGFYHFSASILVTKGSSTRIDCSFIKNGGNWLAAECQGLTTTNTNSTVTNSVDGYLNAGDYIQVETRINDTGSVYAEAKFWNFSGFLVG